MAPEELEVVSDRGAPTALVSEGKTGNADVIRSANHQGLRCTKLGARPIMQGGDLPQGRPEPAPPQHTMPSASASVQPAPPTKCRVQRRKAACRVQRCLRATTGGANLHAPGAQ
jgi:hypothetical protein